MNKLTIEEVQNIKTYTSPLNPQYYKVVCQLLDTMRENERLRVIVSWDMAQEGADRNILPTKLREDKC
ncbi:MAG: hypothetical protein EBR82_82320 [Caulobacteraceae bacterium]|nr:hypothetical protein [Caulobacteraceae bacterium]